MVAFLVCPGSSIANQIRAVKNIMGTSEGSRLPLSVVIPTFNAARTVAATIATVHEAAAEVIIADGGSSDATVAIAHRLGARVVAAAPGRGAQLAAGCAAAGHDWLLLLHADTRLNEAWGAAARVHMQSCPGRAAYFSFALDSDDTRARRLERLVACRCRVFGLPYGDQGLLLHRNLLQTVGGVRPLPLMEDVDLVRRLGARRLTAIAVAALTSAEKWQQEGWGRRSLRNLLCLLLYFAGLPPRLIARLY
jgi:rSAM/selenodomain-associated transferase 2